MNRVERDDLVVQNLPLVGYLVAEICMRADHLSREDLTQVGAIALIHCAESFDEGLGVPFGAYARRRIKGAFADELRRDDWATRGARTRMGELAAVKETLTNALNRVPTVDELAAAMGVERAVVEASRLDATRTITPLTDIISEMVADTSQSPEDALVQAEHEEFLTHAVSALPAKMRYVVEQVYYQDRSVKELAAELGSSHSAVSQQRTEGMRLLRDGLERHYLATATADSPAHSRIAASRREDYLAELGTRTYGGATRARLAAAGGHQLTGVPAAG
ncbi:sigma-70 family RNA polymerase sigma factor [Arthrobacter glacialis]|uniref:sigma-70 family RNA polymerase sigma factor n=1 Tax=Arthrobacter glacialis TaxID=1664 RepID=UPI000CD3DD11|nr:sigma-70 family RNA polymerase sigma factor [Arthrobacter glacialis]POH59398.1 flagellar biosynthesis protein FliA [Arthrobacter glacialis]